MGRRNRNALREKLALCAVIASSGCLSLNDSDESQRNFSIELDPTTTIGAQRAKVAVKVRVNRVQGFSSTVSVGLVNPPSGISSSLVEIPHPERDGLLEVSIAESTEQGLTELQVRASGGDESTTAKLALFVRGYPGALDTTFGDDGAAKAELGLVAVGSAMDSNGRIVIAGGSGAPTNFALARIDSDGAYDQTFAQNGALKESNAFESAFWSVAAKPAGKITAVGVWGTCPESGCADVVAERFDETGLPDPTFGVDGRFTWDNGGANETPHATAVLDDGNLLFGGAYAGLGFVGRITPSGELDPGFDEDGIASFGFLSPIYSIMSDANGGVIVAGRATGDSGVFRIDEKTGAQDPSFGVNGITMLGFDGRGGLVLAQDGKGRVILTGGHGLWGPGMQARIVRLDGQGTIDSSFSADAFQIGDGATFGTPFVGSDGKILVTGSIVVGSVMKLALLRYLDDGKLDASFGDQGVSLLELELASSEHLVGVHPVENDRFVLVVQSTETSGARPVLLRVWQ